MIDKRTAGTFGATVAKEQFVGFCAAGTADFVGQSHYLADFVGQSHFLPNGLISIFCFLSGDQSHYLPMVLII